MGETDFTIVQTRANELKDRYAQRNTLLDDLEKMVLMDWGDAPSRDGIKKTVSPSARNAVLGATRLLTAARPQYSVNRDKNSQEGGDKADQMEAFADAILYVSSRLRQNPLEYDAAYSACLFGMVHMSVTSTADLLESTKKGGDKAAVKRLERIAAMTPIVYDVWDPRAGYPEYDNALGLSAYYRRVKMRAGALLDRWGQAAIAAGLDPMKRNEEVDYCDWWDDIYHVAWIDGKSLPLLNAEHNLPVIPIVAVNIEGSFLHAKEEQRIQPILFGIKKSGVWERENLALTVMSSNVFGLAANPTMVYRATQGKNTLYIDHSQPGGVVIIEPNESLEPLNKNPIDPAVWELYRTMGQLVEESSIFKQTLGMPLGGDRSFSETALLNQAGRLPLVPAQRKLGDAFAQAAMIALEIVKAGRKKSKVQGKNGPLEMKPADIPDGLLMECRFGIDLPQDERANAAMVAQLTSRADPKVSLEWALENLLNVQRPKEMIKQIFAERYTLSLLEFEYQKKMAAMQQKMQQELQAAQTQGQPQPGQGMPPQGMPGQMPPGGMPPELMAMMQGGGPQLPPEQAALQQGQVIPPSAQGGVPGLPMAGPQDPGMMGMMQGGMPPEGMV
jgi:hypothetical protein